MPDGTAEPPRAGRFRQRPLRDRLHPAHAAILVVDMQNDFCHPDGVFSKMGVNVSPLQAVASPIARLVGAARTAGVPVIFVRTIHDEWVDAPGRCVRPTPEGMLRHLSPDSWGAEFYGSVPGPGDHIVTKHRHSAFFGTDLAMVLRNRRIEAVVVAGVAANVCVESTVRDACAFDLDVLMAPECVAAPSPEELRSALHNVETFFGQVVGLEQLLDAMQPII